MPNDRDPAADAALARDLAAGAVAPPPPMPVAKLAHTGHVSQASTAAAPTGATPGPQPTTGGWAVDGDRLRDFVYAIERVRRKLWDVQEQVDLMRSTAFTPKLGTSPVARQLERKFADRLDAPLDNPQHPTTGGLRPMLAEAMRRMEEFVAGAEAAARNYRELDQNAAHHHHQSSTGG